MTESEWLTSTDPARMLKAVEPWEHPHLRSLSVMAVGSQTAPYQISDRKLRLFACACCRLTQPMHYPEAKAVVEVAEQVAEDPYPGIQSVVTQKLAEARHSIDAIRGWFWCVTATNIAPALQQTLAEEEPGYGNSGGNYLTQMAALLRDIIGNQFRSAVSGRGFWQIDPKCFDIAQRIYSERRFDDTPVLADALEDSGCDSAELLTHLRGNGHVRGCWVLDTLLGKK